MFKSFKHWLTDGVCISANSSISTFHSATMDTDLQIANKSIRDGILDASSFTSEGGVKVGTQARILVLQYPDGTRTAYLSDPKLENKSIPATNYGGEHNCHENKKGFRIAAKEDIDSLIESGPKQFRIHANELAAMANSRRGDYELTIGTDSDGNVCGIDSEVSNTVDAESQLRNYFSQVLGVSYTAELEFRWERPVTANGHRLVLRILGKKYTGSTPLLVGGTYLYLRSGSNSQRLSGSDLVNFIKGF